MAATMTPVVRWQTMHTADLAALVPDLMARHPAFGWTIASGRAAGEELVVEIHPLAWPERVATVRVNGGAEIFSSAFAGHESIDFAYEDADRPEALQEQIEHAVQVVGGPTRVIRDQVDGTTVKSTLVVDLDGSHPHRDVARYPIRRLKSLLKGSRITRETTDFPATPTGNA